LTDRARATQIGAAARARMIARYSWESRLAGLAGVLGL
jgi:polysaccharide biosynthesis protein PslH